MMIWVKYDDSAATAYAPSYIMCEFRMRMFIKTKYISNT